MFGIIGYGWKVLGKVYGERYVYGFLVYSSQHQECFLSKAKVVLIPVLRGMDLETLQPKKLINTKFG